VLSVSRSQRPQDTHLWKAPTPNSEETTDMRCTEQWRPWYVYIIPAPSERLCWWIWFPQKELKEGKRDTAWASRWSFLVLGFGCGSCIGKVAQAVWGNRHSQRRRSGTIVQVRKSSRAIRTKSSSLRIPFPSHIPIENIHTLWVMWWWWTNERHLCVQLYEPFLCSLAEGFIFIVPRSKPPFHYQTPPSILYEA